MALSGGFVGRCVKKSDVPGHHKSLILYGFLQNLAEQSLENAPPTATLSMGYFWPPADPIREGEP